MAEGPHFTKRLQIRNEVYPVPSLLHACKASRRVAKNHGAWKLWQTTLGRGYIYVNTAKDIFYFVSTGGIQYMIISVDGVDMLCEHKDGAGTELICPVTELADLQHVAFDSSALHTETYENPYGKIYSWMKIWVWPTNLTMVVDGRIGDQHWKFWRPWDQKCSLRFLNDEFVNGSHMMGVKDFEKVLLAMSLDKNPSGSQYCRQEWIKNLEAKNLSAELRQATKAQSTGTNFPNFQYAFCIPDRVHNAQDDDRWWLAHLIEGYSSDSGEDEAEADLEEFEHEVLISQVHVGHVGEGPS